MVTIFVCSAGNHTKNVWEFLDKASWADIRLVELEHLSLKKIMSFCAEQIPVYVHPSFYRGIKLKYPLDIRGVSRHS